MIPSCFKRCGSLHTFFFVLFRGLAAVGLAGCLGGRGLPPPVAGGAPADREAEGAARTLYERGVAQVGERRYEPAYAAFDSVVSLYPGSRYSGIALRERGVAAYRLDRYGRAAEDLRRFLEIAPGYETTDTSIVLASALQLQADSRAGLEALVRYLPESDSDAAGARLVGEAAVRDLESGEASRLAERFPRRAFLAPLFARAAQETRARDPRRAAELARIAERLGARSGGARGMVVAEDLPPGGRREAVGPAVGAILPRDGRLAPVAQDIQDGARIALDDFAAEGGPRLELQVAAEAGAGGTAASLDALADRGVRLVIGPLESEPALAAAPEAARRGVLLVSPTATDSTLLHVGQGVVTLNAVSGELGEAMGRFAVGELGILRAAVIGEDGDYGRANALGFRRVFEERGGEIVVEEFFDKSETNYGAALRLARHRGAEALFLPTRSADQVLTVFSQVEYYSGGTFRMLGTEIWRDERFLQRAGAFAEGGYFADTFSPDPRVTSYADFRAKYASRYGRPPSTGFPAWGYDAVMLAVGYLAGAAPSPIETTYRGASATYRIADGRVEKVPVISRIENGTPVLTSLETGARRARPALDARATRLPGEAPETRGIPDDARQAR